MKDDWSFPLPTILLLNPEQKVTRANDAQTRGYAWPTPDLLRHHLMAHEPLIKTALQKLI